MSDLELCYLSATEAIRLFKAKKLSPVEVLKAQIKRAEEVEPQVNAFCYTFFDEALEAARESEQRYMDGNPRPLEGVTLAVKNTHAIRGQSLTNGVIVQKDLVADKTEPFMQRLLDAGAIVHARTTVPELSMAPVTWGMLWEPTHNPWNLYYTPGGSSGGSGAALAAGTTTLATGSDIGGSTRIPSSYNGLYGFKPPYGRIPRKHPMTQVPYAADGPMARTFEDALIFQNIVAGPHPNDMASLKPKLELPTRYEGIKGWRIAYSMDYGYMEIDPDVRANTEAALKVFESLGATVEEVEIGWDEECFMALLRSLGAGFPAGGAFLVWEAGTPDQFAPYLHKFIELSQGFNQKDLVLAEMTVAQMHDRMRDIFQSGYNVFIAPTLATIGVKADFDYSKDEVIINGKQVEPILGYTLTYHFNLLNRYPVLAVPSGRARNNVPTGIQIVGAPFEDVSVFQAAAAYSSAAPAFFTGDAFPDFRNEPVE